MADFQAKEPERQETPQGPADVPPMLFRCRDKASAPVLPRKDAHFEFSIIFKRTFFLWPPRRAPREM